MALKNHTIDSSKVSEEQIEAIIADRIKYDPANQTVVLLPAARGLTNDRKILLYLAALRGWQFLVKENTPHESATPLEITHATGIPGGSVRPVLRGLEDRKMLIRSKGRYEVPSHNFATIQSLLSTKVVSEPSETHTRLSRKSSAKKSPSSAKAKGKRQTRGSTNKPTLAEGFAKLLDDKWFKGGKNINQLKKKLDEMTVFPPIEQLPWHLLKAYRGGQLDRAKTLSEGKKMLVYSQK